MMIGIKQVIQRFSKQISDPEIIAMFSFCLETLPQLIPSQFSASFGSNVIFSLSPTLEMNDQGWFTTCSEARWPSENVAIDWAYETLEGQTISLLTASPLVSPIFSEQPTIRLYACHNKHRYRNRIHVETVENYLLPALADIASDKESVVLDEEVEFFKQFFHTAETPGFCLWNKSLLDLVQQDNRATQDIWNLCKDPSVLPLLTFSTNASQVYLRLAGQIIEQPVPDRLTDAEVLSALMPWGSRTRLVKGIIQVEQIELQFYSCYVKPRESYPPLRVEVPTASLHEETIGLLLDQLLAYMILNPHLY